ncbi:MAG TPA: hypothetical protein VM052_02025 [Candidatus Limnocylindrales bacterium]|nr:hypothetical protein [Candidatus Limnocylindrales bacterium]
MKKLLALVEVAFDNAWRVEAILATSGSRRIAIERIRRAAA